MATDSAPVSTRSPAQNLWQLPTLLIGIAALAAVWYGRPYLRPTAAQRYERELGQLRQLLEKYSPEPPAVQALLRRIEAVPPPGELAAQASYLRGSAYVVLAESTPESKDAREYWKLAREHLESAPPASLPPGDRQRLPHRLGKAWAQTGVEPQKVIDVLARSLQTGDDPTEAYRILAGLYLKVNPPEVKHARDALREYLSRALPRTDPRVLNEARLQLGELYTQLGEVDDARKVLERIGPDAPADVYVAARSQLAHGYQAEGDHAQAIRHYEQARDFTGVTTAQKAPVLYQLATCYSKLNRRAEAIAALEELRKGTGVEAQAAGFRIAELRLREQKDRDSAAKALEAALVSVNSPDDYQNPLLPLNEARAIVEETAGIYRVGGEFELALRVIRAYAHIALAGRDKEMLVETSEAWANALIQQAARDEVERPRLEEAAQLQYRQAATVMQAILDAKDPADRAPILKHAADLWVKAGDRARAVKLLGPMSDAAVPLPEPRSDDWFAKGEAALKAGDKAQALQAFEKALMQDGPHVPMARLNVAILLLETSDPAKADKALAYLEENLRPELQKDREAHEGSVYQLAFALYQRRDWHKAEFRLTQALELYPDSPQAVRARFHLGRCFWFMAAQEARQLTGLDQKLEAPNLPDGEKQKLKELRETGNDRYNEHLRKAKGHFEKVETQLLAAQMSGPLSAADAVWLRQGSLAAGECAFYLGEYEDCIQRYEKIRDRYAGKIGYLMASNMLWQCYYFMKQPQQAKFVLAKMRESFAKMPDSEFDGRIPESTREFWEKWFQQAEGSLASSD